jgi:hypothetical protein
MPIHFVRTRRSALGLVVGIALSAALLAIEAAVEALLDALPPLDLGPEGASSQILGAGLDVALFYASFRIVRRASRA